MMQVYIRLTTLGDTTITIPDYFLFFKIDTFRVPKIISLFTELVYLI